MMRGIIRVFFILSISLNIAFAVYLFSSATTKENNNLQLTAPQIKVVKEIRQNVHQENEKIKKEIIQCQKDMLVALKKEKVNKETISQCIDKISNLQKKIQLNTIDEILQVKEKLNQHQCNCLIDDLGTKLSQTSKGCSKECCNPTK